MTETLSIPDGTRFLLIGDSITDAGRREDPEGLGLGYVRMFRDLCWVRFPAVRFTLINRGVSGDTIRHLDARWHEDMIDLRPDLLSISIGVNDVWRQLQEPANPEEVFLDEFETTCRRLLTQARDACACRLLLCEPTINGERRETPHNRLTEPYIECVHRLAREFDAALVPMNQAFWRVIDADPAKTWTTDGVHPTSNGHMVMAVTLLETLCQCQP